MRVRRNCVLVCSVLFSGCAVVEQPGASVDGGAAPDASAVIVDSGVSVPVLDASKPPPVCVCPMVEDVPTASAKYIGPCGDYDLFEEHGAGVVSSLFVCVARADGGGVP